jgi:aspartate-semialdehyde dehydrogenase
MRLHNTVIVGASGLVGRKIIELLIERKFPLGKVTAIASENSDGKEISVSGHAYNLHKPSEELFENNDFAFFSAGAAVSHHWGPVAAEKGCLVIDNSSAFRMDQDVPLVVPEVNREDIFHHKGIIANPNCSTIQLVVALKPLHDEFRIRRLVVSTYQSVSGAGQKGVHRLRSEIRNDFDGPTPFAHKIAFNALPHIDVFFEDGYTKEEHKLINETRKIMHAHELKITATCVRVPTIGGHAESVNIEFEKAVSPQSVRRVLESAKGIVVIDDPGKNQYPMPADTDERDEVFVGRIRKDESVKNGINIWVVADNVRKGAATNAVQIAEEFLKGKK